MKIGETNLFGVGIQGDRIVAHASVFGARVSLTREEAANLAAWLLVLSFCPKEDFDRLVEAIEST